MLKIISLVCAIGVIALGVTMLVFTFTGLVFPRPLTYIFWVLFAINGVFLAKSTKKKG